MRQQTLDGVDLTDLRQQYRTLVHEQLPSTAEERTDWPVERDHCFARIVLDNLYEDEWYDHVDGRPAYKHLSGEELKIAIRTAETLLEQGKPLVEALNIRSLRWRGEL